MLLTRSGPRTLPRALLMSGSPTLVYTKRKWQLADQAWLDGKALPVRLQLRAACIHHRGSGRLLPCRHACCKDSLCHPLRVFLYTVRVTYRYLNCFQMILGSY
jgi:hypothetical protein